MVLWNGVDEERGGETCLKFRCFCCFSPLLDIKHSWTLHLCKYFLTQSKEFIDLLCINKWASISIQFRIPRYMIIRGRGNNYGNDQNNVKFVSAFGIVTKKRTKFREKYFIFIQFNVKIISCKCRSRSGPNGSHAVVNYGIQHIKHRGLVPSDMITDIVPHKIS